nr:hypothetical protein Iba_chr08dCG4490 [Ipomoea batatas]
MATLQDSRGVSWDTSSWTIGLSENSGGYCFLTRIRMNPRTMPTRSDVIEATTTENFALLGCPAPSSFDTLTLHTALNPRATMSVHPKSTHHIEIASIATSASLRYPANRISDT